MTETKAPEPVCTIEVHCGDGNHPPGQPGLNINSSIVWLRINGRWHRTSYRSFREAVADIKTLVNAQPVDQ